MTWQFLIANRVSNRTWRDNLSPGMTVGSDELYSYDQLQRLQNLNRGTLNTGGTAITSPTFGQNWTLDETGTEKKGSGLFYLTSVCVSLRRWHARNAFVRQVKSSTF